MNLRIWENDIFISFFHQQACTRRFNTVIDLHHDQAHKHKGPSLCSWEWKGKTGFSVKDEEDESTFSHMVFLSLLNNVTSWQPFTRMWQCQRVNSICFLHSAGSISTCPFITSCFITLPIFLTAKPGILSGCLGDETDFPGHFHVVDPPAVLKVLPLALSAWLLEVALALHSVNNPLLYQDPGVCRENVWTAWDLCFQTSNSTKHFF